MAHDLAGKNVVITGATSGIGRVAAAELANRGARVIVANRSVEKSAPGAEVVRLDLGDFGSVRAAAAEILAKNIPIHILINNAGLGGQRGLTTSGYELAFGTNHLGHFLFTNLLLERIRERIVTVASVVHERATGIDFAAVHHPTRSLTGLPEYAVSKLANILFSSELARRLEGTGVTTYALHPGGVATEVYRKIPQPFRWFMLRRMLTPEQGATATLRCATDPALAHATGLYYGSRGDERSPSRLARDRELASELWRRSEGFVGL